jgi:hypothetical protein
MKTGRADEWPGKGTRAVWLTRKPIVKRKDDEARALGETPGIRRQSISAKGDNDTVFRMITIKSGNFLDFFEKFDPGPFPDRDRKFRIT